MHKGTLQCIKNTADGLIDVENQLTCAKNLSVIAAFPPPQLIFLNSQIGINKLWNCSRHAIFFYLFESTEATRIALSITCKESRLSSPKRTEFEWNKVKKYTLNIWYYSRIFISKQNKYRNMFWSMKIYRKLQSPAPRHSRGISAT